MRDRIEVSGVVLSSTPVGDYDKRVVLLTKERGKLTAFARGARKPSGSYVGLCEPFNYGTFYLYEGYDAYRFAGGEVREYFADVKGSIEGICYGTYFCDVCEYLSVEGVGDVNEMNLLYLSLKALVNPAIPNPLIRRIFELRMLSYDGEMMAAFACTKCGNKKVTGFAVSENGLVCTDCARGMHAAVAPLLESSVYTLQYILSAPLGNLYAFQVSDAVFAEIDAVIDAYFTKHVPKKFNSLQILLSLA